MLVLAEGRSSDEELLSLLHKHTRGLRVLVHSTNSDALISWQREEKPNDMFGRPLSQHTVSKSF